MRGLPPVQVSAEDNPTDLSAYVTALYQTRRTAMARLAAQCAALGGDGVVAVRLGIGRFLSVDRSFEFRVTGTAVRAHGTVRPARPFMAPMSGQDFVKLVASGWIPVDLALGAAVGIRHRDYLGVQSVTGRFAPAKQVPGWSDLVARTRREARRHLTTDAAGTGAEGVLLSSSELQVSERKCKVVGGEDDVAEATMIGSAIVCFRRGRHLPSALPVLRF
jgi:uncharacterized protein YbjQ (UPF0145 family)